MHKLTKATAIPPKVKQAVWRRDKEQCALCHSPRAAPVAHFIRRSRGGLGIEQNILTLCRECHTRYDSGPQDDTDEWYCWFKAYLMSHYPGWSEARLVYNKYDESGLDIWPEEDEEC